MYSVDFTEAFDWDYLLRTWLEYCGTPAFMVVYIIILLILLIQKNRTWREVFVYPFLIQLLTVFNIFLLDFLIPKLSLTTRYYRFFWILPVSVLLGIFCVWMISKIRVRVCKAVVLFLFIGGILYVGYPCRAYNYDSVGWPSMSAKENEYKIPNYIVELSDILHSEGLEEPIVVYGYTEQLFLREYDGRVRSVFERNDTLYMQTYSEEEMEQILASDRYKDKLWLLVFQGRHLEKEVLDEALEALNADYIVLDNSVNDNADYAMDLGYECIGNAENRYVFRVS